MLFNKYNKEFLSIWRIFLIREKNEKVLECYDSARNVIGLILGFWVPRFPPYIYIAGKRGTQKLKINPITFLAESWHSKTFSFFPLIKKFLQILRHFLLYCLKYLKHLQNFSNKGKKWKGLRMLRFSEKCNRVDFGFLGPTLPALYIYSREAWDPKTRE